MGKVWRVIIVFALVCIFCVLRVRRHGFALENECGGKIVGEELCESELYKDTCVLLKAINKALENAVLSSRIRLWSMISPESPRTVIVVAALDTDHAWTWKVSLDIEDTNTTGRRRPMTILEISNAADVIAHRVKERSWQWIEGTD